MPRINKSSIGELQNTTLNEKINDSFLSIDLNWEGYDRASDSPLIKEDIQAHMNRCLLWLASKPNDYVRESTKGGVLFSLLNQLTNETNLSEWETIIQERFNMEFANDLSLMYVKLSKDDKKKALQLEMLVQDKINKKTFTIQTEAAI